MAQPDRAQVILTIDIFVNCNWGDTQWQHMVQPDRAQMILTIDIFVNCNWGDTQWQQYRTHLHTNNTQNYTINNFGWKAFRDLNPEWSS